MCVKSATKNTPNTPQLIRPICPIGQNICKVKKISEDSLDLITSYNSNYRQKNVKQNIAELLKTKKFVDNAQQCFACMPQANFPAHNLNFD